MNKNEAIKIVEQDKIQVARFVEINREVNVIQRKVEMVDYVPLETVINIFDKISETDKATVPKFVAEWIEDHKGDYSKWDEEARADFVFRAINDLFRFGEGLILWDFIFNEKISDWTTKNAYEFITAILFGYEIEKEKLYTVEIPDPHGMYKIRFLYRGSDGNIRIGCSDYKDIFSTTGTHLTEAEIKQDFEWAWQWAKPVEEEE